MQWLDAAYSSVRGGKGRPAGSDYHYAASFAVALSTRAIVRVGRIWAEGKLLRGAAGDWKTPTGFRLYPGSEAQMPDPLIASLERHAPAHRGMAYAVFENLPLADFGNRIPSLTFEVVADAAPPTIGAVARALAPGVLVGEGPATTVHGYAASGDSVAGAVETLAAIAGAWIVPDGGALRIAETIGAATLVNDVAVRETRRPIETVPRRLSLSCYDPDRDYQIGVQQAQRPGGAGWRDDTLDLPAALPAAQARGVAQAAIRRAEQARVTRRVTLDASACGYAPGDAVRLEGSAVWRVTRVAVQGDGVTLDLMPLSAGAVDLLADAGQALAAPDQPVAATLLVAAELPPLDDGRGDVPRILVCAGGDRPGWRRAALSVSSDGGASWEPAGVTAAPAVIGRVTTPVPAASPWLVDRRGAIEVMLAEDGMLLASVTDAAFDRGANLAAIGGELVQFRDAVQIAPCRWRLTTLLRGRRGTAAAAQAAGASFALLDEDGTLSLPLPRARPGETIRLLASGSGDAQPVAATVVLSGASLAPPAPVRLRATRVAEGVLVRWVRRSRLGWRWDDGMDAPLGEEREAYAVTMTQGATVRALACDVPEVLVPAALLAGGAVRVTVRQQGTLAASAPGELTIEGGA